MLNTVEEILARGIEGMITLLIAFIGFSL